MSSGKPLTPRGVETAVIASRSMRLAPAGAMPGMPLEIESQIGVSMIPGCTEFTRTPSFSAAHSMATDLVKRRTRPWSPNRPPGSARR